MDTYRRCRGRRPVAAVLFDFSGTLLRLEEDESWFAGMQLPHDAGVDGHVQAELMFEVGAVKPDPAIFRTALDRLGVAAADTSMVGDSDEADGAARELGCGFVLADPMPTAQRPDGLRKALAGYGHDLWTGSVADMSSSERSGRHGG